MSISITPFTSITTSSSKPTTSKLTTFRSGFFIFSSSVFNLKLPLVLFMFSAYRIWISSLHSIIILSLLTTILFIYRLVYLFIAFFTSFITFSTIPIFFACETIYYIFFLLSLYLALEENKFFRVVVLFLFRELLLCLFHFGIHLVFYSNGNFGILRRLYFTFLHI